jgi:hypothetical protein
LERENVNNDKRALAPPMFGRKKKKAKGGDGGKKHKEVGSKVEIEGFTVTIDKELAEGVHFLVTFPDLWLPSFLFVGSSHSLCSRLWIDSRSGERTPYVSGSRFENQLSLRGPCRRSELQICAAAGYCKRIRSC